MASSFYQHPVSKLRQGDIAACQFSQLRARSGDRKGPGDARLANEDLPYLGPYQDYPIRIDVPDTDAVLERVVRVWFGYGLVLHQNCEIEYADSEDSRILVAPIVSERQWPSGPWDLIRRAQLPGYFYLPPLSQEEAAEHELPNEWPDSAVAFASATCLSTGIVQPNRVLALQSDKIANLQELLVRYGTVRGWGSHESLEALVGWQITAVEQTKETVPGPSPLAKVFLQKDGNPEEISVVWGVRRSARAVQQ